MNLTWDGIIGGGVGTIAVGMACWALTVAKGQLTAMVGQTAAMLQQTKVDTLLTLAERWGSEPLLSIRADLFKLLEEVLEVAKARWAHLAKEERRAHVENEFRTRLVQIRQQSPEQFQRLFEVCGFLETVGYLAKQNHLPVEETTGLFGVGIDQAALVFGSWIKQMHSEGGDPTMYECFLWLAANAEARSPKN